MGFLRTAKYYRNWAEEERNRAEQLPYGMWRKSIEDRAANWEHLARICEDHEKWEASRSALGDD